MALVEVLVPVLAAQRLLQQQRSEAARMRRLPKGQRQGA